MGKRVLYYLIHNPMHKSGQPTYVHITYTDGSTRTIYPNERGYKSARAKAMKANK